MNVLKKHWRFLATLVVLAVLLVFGYGEVGAKGKQVDTVAKSVQSKMAGHYRDLFKDAETYDGRPATSQGLSLAAQMQYVQDIEKRRNSQLRWETDSQYTLAARPPESSNEDLIVYFQEKQKQLQRDLGYQPNVSFSTDAPDALGFTPKAPDKTDRDVTADNLARLDMVRVVAASSLRAGVQSLRKLRFVDGGTGVQALAARGLPVRGAGKDAAGKENPAYLKPRLLEVTVRGSEEALYNFLVDLQRPVKGDLRNRYLAIEGLVLDKPDVLSPSDDLISGVITVAAYSIHEEAPLPGLVKSSKGEEGAAGQPRRFR